jgi:hypothetical protein
MGHAVLCSVVKNMSISGAEYYYYHEPYLFKGK